jgi:hypothetical protein
MPLFAALVALIADRFFGAWADTLTRKAAIIAAGIALIVTLTTGFVATGIALVNSLLPQLPAVAGTAVYLFVPYTAVPCLAAMFACDAACGVYAWARSHVVLAAQVAG